MPPPPVCTDVSVTVTAGIASPVRLACTGQALAYAQPGSPAHGALSEFSSAAGTVSYTASPDYAGPDTFTFTATNAGGASNTATVHVTVKAPPPVVVTPPPPVTPPPVVTPPPTAPQLALTCAHARLVLLDVLPAAHHRVLITGAADPALAGGRLAVRRDRTHAAGSLAINADGTFSGAVKPPPAADLARARYEVEAGGQVSASLKLERRMVLPPPKLVSGGVRVSGHVVGPLPRTPQTVLITRATTCNGFVVVATVKAGRNGSFSATAPLPPAPFRAAFYRAQTLVPKRRGGPARDKTYTLPQPVGR